MCIYLGMYFALSTLGSFVLPAPVPESQHMEVLRSAEFQDASESALSLMTKILNSIPDAHKSLIHTPTLSLDESDLSTLQFLKESLDLPEPSPLQPLSDNFQLDVSLGRIVEGLKLHKTLLKVMGEMENFKSKMPHRLLYELRDALLNLHKMQLLIKAVTKGPEKVSESQLQKDLAPKLKNEYVAQVAAHLALIQLRQFTRDTSRSLQSMIVPLPEHETQDS